MNYTDLYNDEPGKYLLQTPLLEKRNPRKTPLYLRSPAENAIDWGAQADRIGGFEHGDVRYCLKLQKAIGYSHGHRSSWREYTREN